MEQFQPFRNNLHTFSVTGPVTFAAGSVQAGNEIKLDWIAAVVKTMGISVVAFIAITFAGVLVATSTAPRRRTRSAANACNRS